MAKKPTKAETQKFIEEGLSFEDLKTELTKASVKADVPCSDDVVGFWEDDLSPIFCTPQFVKLSDSKAEKLKPSALVFVKLERDCAASRSTPDSGAEVFRAKRGDLVGIWYRPGLRGIEHCAGIPTLIVKGGTKNTGKVNDLQMYEVNRTLPERRALEVVSDARVHSRAVATPFKGGEGRIAPPAASEEDLPF
jgi:hypothetical protein